MSRIGSRVEPRPRTLTFALTPSIGAQEPVPVNITADEQSNTTFVDADAFAPFGRLGISPVPVDLLLPAVQSARER